MPALSSRMRSRPAGMDAPCPKRWDCKQWLISCSCEGGGSFPNVAVGDSGDGFTA